MNNKEVAEIKKKAAIVILAYADYESLELALASHAKYSVDAGLDIYILQNGRGTYDCERTYEVAKRYHYLYPETIFVVDDIKPGIPFKSLKTLFGSKRFEKYDYIIKLDDDVMVLTKDWIDKLCSCYIDGKKKYGDDFAYATSLVNNNPYGFKKIIDNSKELADEYFSKIARKQYVGPDFDYPYGPHRILPKEEIYSGANGTVWRYPYIARWLHEKTTLNPQWYIDFASKLKIEPVNNKERYSINCLIFEKKLWLEELSPVEPKSTDDEHLLQAYCLKYNKKILADLSIPMIHLFFFSQRAECKDMIDDLRVCYTDFFKLPFPIATCNNRLVEIENRLRYLEQAQAKKASERGAGLVTKGMKYVKDNGVKRTIKQVHKRVWRR
jgi:hypothetical protein